jgi:uncharacterized protein (TIGR01777 family)
MRILITGGSGFLGQALASALLERGDEVLILSRNAANNAQNKMASHWIQSLDAIDKPIDAVFNLTGANLFSRPWTKARKRELRDSRIALTQTLVAWLNKQTQAPRVLLSGSAIGIYGDQGEHALTEQSEQGKDWAANLVADWEAAAANAGTRIVNLRTGLVLGDGGLLQPLRPVFKLGIGGSLGDGRFWYSWIHLQDWVSAALFLLDLESASGPYNLTAPAPVRYKEFAQGLGKALHRPVWLTPPAWILKLMLREQASLLLSSTKAMPLRLQQAGFQWRHPKLPEALAELFKPAP